MPHPREQAVRSIVASPYSRQLGLSVEEVRQDAVCVRMAFSPELSTLGDTVHGGAIAGLLDAAATATAWSGVDEPDRHRGTTIGFSVNFLDAARGVDLLARGRVIRRGGSVVVCGVSVHSDDGRHVAEGLVTYKLSRR